MTVTVRSREKENLMQQLEKLLEVAGTEMPWKDLSFGLRRLTVPELRALVYRVQQARSDSYEEGARPRG